MVEKLDDTTNMFVKNPEHGADIRFQLETGLVELPVGKTIELKDSDAEVLLQTYGFLVKTEAPKKEPKAPKVVTKKATKKTTRKSK